MSRRVCGGAFALAAHLSIAAFAGWVPHAHGQPAESEGARVSDVVGAREAFQEKAQQAQDRIANLDDETVSLLSEYNAELEQLENLTTYNANLRDLLTSQAREREQLQTELREIEVVKRELVPLMKEMVDVLEKLIELDQPILEDERRARLASAKLNVTRSDIDLAERYRRLIEAYQIEAEYGQTIEAYEGVLSRAGRDITVDYLHIGRVALYYVTLDRSEAGIWDQAQRAWVELPQSTLDDLDYALRVARKQAPPDLMPLPLWTPER